MTECVASAQAAAESAVFGGKGAATATANAEAAAKLQNVKDKVSSACAASELSGRKASGFECQLHCQWLWAAMFVPNARLLG